MKIDGFELNNVVFDNEHIGSSVIDYRYMREGDYVKRLRLSGVEANGVETLAKVHKRCEEFDVELDENCKCPDKIEMTEPLEVKQSDISYIPFSPNITRNYN